MKSAMQNDVAGAIGLRMGYFFHTAIIHLGAGGV